MIKNTDDPSDVVLVDFFKFYYIMRNEIICHIV